MPSLSKEPYVMKKQLLFTLILLTAMACMAQEPPTRHHRGNRSHGTTITARPHHGHGNYHWHHNNGHHTMAPMGMNTQDYEYAYRMIADESFDSSRLKLAKQIIKTNPMSVNQIMGICKLFSFESNKLDFAKYAYRHCTDRNRYFMLDEVFNFKSSKRELRDYTTGL